MWRWESIQEFQYPVLEYLSALKSKPLFIGIESVVAGHEHTSMSVITGQMPSKIFKQKLPTGPGYSPLGNADALAQWEYCFDRGDTDISRGNTVVGGTEGNNWDCSIPGSPNSTDPLRCRPAVPCTIGALFGCASPSWATPQFESSAKWARLGYPAITMETADPARDRASESRARAARTKRDRTRAALLSAGETVAGLPGLRRWLCHGDHTLARYILSDSTGDDNGPLDRLCRTSRNSLIERLSKDGHITAVIQIQFTGRRAYAGGRSPPDRSHNHTATRSHASPEELHRDRACPRVRHRPRAQPP